jgi:hypothetical protein
LEERKRRIITPAENLLIKKNRPPSALRKLSTFYFKWPGTKVIGNE